MSTTIMVIAAAGLVIVHVVVAEVIHRARLRQVHAECAKDVADQIHRLEMDLETAREASAHNQKQLKRCRETLREVLGEIEVMG